MLYTGWVLFPASLLPTPAHEDHAAPFLSPLFAQRYLVSCQHGLLWPLKGVLGVRKEGLSPAAVDFPVALCVSLL